MALGDTMGIKPARGYVGFLNETDMAHKDIVDVLVDVFDTQTINTIKGKYAEKIKERYLFNKPIKQQDVEHFDANTFTTQVGNTNIANLYLNDLLQFTIDNYSRENNEYMKNILEAQKKIQYLKSA